MRNKENRKSGAPKIREFKQWGKRLRRAAQNALDAAQASETKLRPRDRADNVFKLSAYEYFRELKQAGLIDRLRQHVQERDGDQWKRHRDSEELWIVRLAAKAEHTDRMRKKRDRWAAELKLADINDVRPELLLGFLHEAGPTDLIEKDASAGVWYDWADCYRKGAMSQRTRRARPKAKVTGG